MSQLVTFYDEDHGFSVNMIAVWLGHDEDGRDQYEILHSADIRSGRHEECDLSLETS